MSKWPMVKLGEVVGLLNGFAFDSKKFTQEQGTPLIRIRDVKNGTTSTFYDGEFDSKYLIHPGEAIVGMDGDFNCSKWGEVPALLNQRVCKVYPKSPQIDGDYLYFALPRLLHDIWVRTPYVTVKHLSSKVLLNASIPLPPLEEQKRIAGILEASARQVEDVQNQISNIDQLRITAFGEAMSKPGSELHPLGSLCVGKPEYGIGASATTYAPEKGRYLRITDIEDDGSLTDTLVSPDGSIEELPESKCVKQGDLLFARTGATVGKTYLHETGKGKYWFAGYLVRFKVNPDLVDSKIVFDYCHSPAYWAWVKNRQQVAAQPNINAKVYANELMIPVPSPLAAGEYLAVRGSIEANISLLKKKLGVLQELHQSLVTRAFAGEL